MSYFLGDISAFELWFGEQRGVRRCRPEDVVPAYARASASARALPLEELRRLGLRRPWHMDVPTHAAERHSSGVISHVVRNPPPYSFVRLSDELYVESAAAALLHVAQRLSLGNLVVALNQLFGSFGLTSSGMVEREPLMSCAQAEAYAAASSGTRGVARFRRALRYRVPHTASPAEARVAALLVLPPSLGGRGLPLPVANVPLNVASAHTMLPRVADFYWDRWNLVLEYDSDEYHAGREKLAADNVRRAQLTSAGYQVVTLTNYQLHDARAFEDVLEVLVRAMGRTGAWKRHPSYPALERGLRRDVLGSSPLRELGIE